RLARQRLLFDGSMGALLSQMGYRGECTELHNVEHPDVVLDIHRRYLAAGADVIIANSLGATTVKLRRMGLSDRADELTAAAVRLARRAAGDRALVALDVGTVGEFLRPAGSLEMAELIESFRRCMAVGAAEGADLILMETMTDIAECRAGALAGRALGLPIACSFTFEPNGRTLTGGTPACAALALGALGVAAMGINCSAAPASMPKPLAAMRAASPLPVIVQPNAGLPIVDSRGETRFPIGPDEMRPQMADILAAGAAAIGGCCGTTPEHIAKMRTLDLSQPPESGWDGVARICGGRVSLPLSEAIAGLREAEDVDALYDLDEDAACALIPLRGLSPDQAAELAREAQAATSLPLAFAGGSAEALRAALTEYAGVAGVQCDGANAAVAAQFGALPL
ncbi:MAG: homocysteine S-methyltransferase family protein, partial [Clostridiales bacterium]|nr:homocysteine S-methyltransferase family protein [Clostridiales bacterium]